MKPRHRAAGEPRSIGDGVPAGADGFHLHAHTAHAWFASQAVATLPAARAPMLPALKRAELVLAREGRAVARRPTRIPADAIVAIGRRHSPLRREAAAPPVANDNGPRPGGRTGTVLREVVFLVIFGATLAGTYYLGRMHAYQNVIVVPEPVSAAASIV